MSPSLSVRHRIEFHVDEGYAGEGWVTTRPGKFYLRKRGESSVPKLANRVNRLPRDQQDAFFALLALTPKLRSDEDFEPLWVWLDSVQAAAAE